MSLYLFLCIVNAVVGTGIICVKLVKDGMYPGFWRTVGCFLCAYGPVGLACLIFHRIMSIGYNVPDSYLSAGAFIFVVAFLIVFVPAAIMDSKEKK